ncbi:unnamed protein product [Lampetra planeri]
MAREVAAQHLHPSGPKTAGRAGRCHSNGAARARSEPAILDEPHGVQGAGAATESGQSGANRTRRLPQVKEFIAAGGDWSTFTWRYEAAFRSVHWMEDAALVALPTVLDDDALAVFRSIPLEKSMLQGAHAEMAEVYEPPSDTR